MARVKFSQDFDYSPRSGVVIGYKAGMVETVRRECADQAIAAQKATELPKLRRSVSVVED